MTRERARCHPSTGSFKRLPSLPCAPRVDLDQQAATQSRLANTRSFKEHGPGLAPHPPYPVRSGLDESLGAMEAAITKVSPGLPGSPERPWVRPGCRKP